MLDVYKERGAVAVLQEGIPFVYYEWIRPHVPKQTRTIEFNQIETKSDDICWLDLFIPFYDPPWYTVSDPEYEAAAINALRKQVNPGDTTMVVGAGLGITAAVAAFQSGPDGSVIAFEGAKERFQDAYRTIKHNDLNDRISIHHGIVADAGKLYGSNKGSDIIKISDLPDCDVLEMDCEGAEELIIPNLDIRPRIIIVETHGNKSKIYNELNQLGYTVVNSTKENVGGIFVLTAINGR